MVRGTEPHQPLMRCNVFYMGNYEPTPGTAGVEVLNNPLKKAYPAHSTQEVRGIDAWLTIYTSGIQLQLVGARSPTAFWFQIQNLYIAAATKCVNRVDAAGQIQDSKFVELTDPTADQSSHAPLFAFALKVNRRQNMQCHVFMAKNKDAALTLVEACKHAYTNKQGHSEYKIPAEIAASEMHVDDSDSDDDDISTNGNTLRVINVDEIGLPGMVDATELFPKRLAKTHKIENLRPQKAYAERPQTVPEPRTQPIRAPPVLAPQPTRVPYYPSPLSPISAFDRYPPQEDTTVRRTKIVRPPPIYIRAPPPRVIPVREPPRIIRTPPQIIRQPIYIPVEKIVEKPIFKEVQLPPPPPIVVKSEPEIVEVPKPYPVPVRAPTPEPQYIEVPVYIEKPPQIIREPPEIREIEVPVPYEVRRPTPPPQIIEVPVYIESPPQIIREPPEIVEVPVPVPYEVQLPPPPPEIREVYIEVPPVYIKEPPEIQEIPVPYPVPYEIPIHTPIEIPRFYPIPIKNGKSRKKLKDAIVYDDWYYGDERRYPYFMPSNMPPPMQSYEWEESSRRSKNRRSRRKAEKYGYQDGAGLQRRPFEPTYEMSNGLHGMRITEVDDQGRPINDNESPRRNDRDNRRSPKPTVQNFEEVDGYDYYKNPSQSRTGGSRRQKKEDPYHVKTRYRTTNEYENGYNQDQLLSPSASGVRLDQQMPGHLSDSEYDFPPPPQLTSRSKNTFYQ